ncbi:MAG TPA: hypothetical protein H9915_09380 [Candidatus Gemmiger faecigallinarum]|nr:hypothetical protein [Candidatus Gemmiger faecigallinarum]
MLCQAGLHRPEHGALRDGRGGNGFPARRLYGSIAELPRAEKRKAEVLFPAVPVRPWASEQRRQAERIETELSTHYNFSKYYAKCKPKGAKNRHFLGNAAQKMWTLCWKSPEKSDIMDDAEHDTMRRGCARHTGKKP